MATAFSDPEASWPLVLTGLAGSTAAGVATGVGALPVFFIRFIRTLSDRVQAAFLGAPRESC